MSHGIGKINLDEKVGGIKKTDSVKELQAKLITIGMYTSNVIAEFSPKLASDDPDGDEARPADIVQVYKEVGKLADEVTELDSTKGIERRLVGQMIALDAIFNDMAVRAHRSKYLKDMEAYMRMALKAQAQSRCTAEAIANIKNPKQIAFVRQANIAHGHQQINNGQETTPTRTRESFSESAPNELLEVSNGNYLDTGAQGASGRDDPAMATVGKIDRSKDTRGQRAGGKKRLEGRASTPDA